MLFPLPLNPFGLLLNASQRANGYVFVGVLHRHQPWFGWVFELVVRALDPTQNPAVLLKFFYHKAAMHGSYYNHQLFY
jgi:hypothetical protein